MKLASFVSFAARLSNVQNRPLAKSNNCEKVVGIIVPVTKQTAQLLVNTFSSFS